MGPERSWGELEPWERMRILEEEAKAEPDFHSVEPEAGGDLDVSVAERAGLRFAAAKKKPAACVVETSRGAKGVLGMLLRPKGDCAGDGPGRLDEDPAHAGDEQGRDPVLDAASKPDNSDAEFWESLGDPGGHDDGPHGGGKRGASRPPPRGDSDKSLAEGGAQKQRRSAARKQVEAGSASEAGHPSRRSLRLAEKKAGAEDAVGVGVGKVPPVSATTQAAATGSEADLQDCEMEGHSELVQCGDGPEAGGSAPSVLPPGRGRGRGRKRSHGNTSRASASTCLSGADSGGTVAVDTSTQNVSGGRDRSRARKDSSPPVALADAASAVEGVGTRPPSSAVSEGEQQDVSTQSGPRTRAAGAGRRGSRGRAGRGRGRRGVRFHETSADARESCPSSEGDGAPVGLSSLPASQDGSRGRGRGYWRGARRRGSARAVRAAEDQAAERSAGGVGGADVVVDLARNRSQQFDWLHRGTREPLASMGMTHYSMFVYTTHAPRGSAAAPPDDFATFRFIDTHPQCAFRVQKLRVSEMCRVPRLCGFTMPRFDGSEVDRFRNTLFKSVLLRPCQMSREHGCDDLVEPYIALVDSFGDFVEPWLAWFAQQRCMADRYKALEAKVGKVFTIEDIDRSVAYMENPELDPRFVEGGRLQPSAAEFMANITVEVATNMDLGAEARAGRRVGARPDASMFVTEEGFLEAGGGVDDGHEGDDEEESDPRAVGRRVVGKLYESRLPVAPADVLRVACCEEHAPAPVMAEYLKSFQEGMGAVQKACLEGPDGSSGVTWGGRLRSQMLSQTGSFAMYRDRQKNLFEAWRHAAQHNSGDGVESHGIRHNLSSQPAPAHMGRCVTPQTFVEQAMLQAQQRAKNPIKDFNKEQKDFMALMTVKVQELLDAGYKKSASADQPDSGYEVPKVQPMRIFLGGPGGAGKSECIDIAGQMIEHFFGTGSKRVLAASNSAARGVRGETVHSGLFLGGQCSFRLGSKAMKGQPTPACQESWAPVKALFLEEVSMISPCMLAGISYRLCRARQAMRPWLDKRLYEHEDHMFGGIPIVVMLGDFMQLGAMERGLGRVSLIMKPKPSWYDECYAGRRIFWRGLTHVVMLRKTHRFRDDIMPRFLEYMRNPGGKPMPDDLRRELAKWEVLSPSPSKGGRDKVAEWRKRCVHGDPVLGEDGTVVGRRPWQAYDMGIAWQAVQRLVHYRAVRDAREQKQLLLYAQAVETCTAQPLSQADYRRALQVVNMNTTGKLLGYCPIYKGMRVRLTAKLSGKHNVVHDAVGTVTDVWLHERDRAAELQWEENPEHEVRHRGIAHLGALPLGVLVQFDDLEEDPCGLGKGVVLVEPHVSYWKYKTHENLTGKRKQAEVSMARRQIPLAPEPVRTVQTAQGMSMDAAMIFMGKPGNMDDDDFWMHLYVMISRVRRSAGLLAFDVPSLRVFERGPPPWVTEGIEALERLCSGSMPAIRAARQQLGGDWVRDEVCADAPVPVDSAVSARVPPSENDAVVLPDDEGEVEEESGELTLLSGLARLQHRLRVDSVGGLGFRGTSMLGRCSDVKQASGQKLLRGASLLQLQELGLEEKLKAVSMTAQRCVGFENPDNDICYVTAPMQMLLRLEPVAEALRRHALFHTKQAGVFPDGCLDCHLSQIAQTLRAGGIPDVRSVVTAAHSGVLGKKPLARGADSVASGPGDALSVLFGRVTARGVIEHSGLVDCLSGGLEEGAASAALPGRKKTSSFSNSHVVREQRRIFRDVLFGCVVRERAYCTACRRGTDVLKDRCFISLQVGAKASATPLRLEDLLESWTNVGGPKPKCERGCVNSRCDLEQRLEQEPPVLAIVLNRLEGGKKRRSPVCFPEELRCMRSGRYTLASVLLHRGAGAEDGHFLSICSCGVGNYVECDDKDLRELSWSDVATLSTWQDAYVLVYCRRVAMMTSAPSREGVASRPRLSAGVGIDEGDSLPQFLPMSAGDRARAREQKATAAERRLEEGRRRGIGDLRGARSSCGKVALAVLASMQRKQSTLDSHDRRLGFLRQHYGADLVDGYLNQVGGSHGVDLSVLEGVLAADLARSVVVDVDVALSSAGNASGAPTRWQYLLDSLPDELREGLLVVLQREYRGQCASILSQEWSYNWVGWDSRQPNGEINSGDGLGLYQLLQVYQEHPEGVFADRAITTIHDAVRRHIRLAHTHAAVDFPTDTQKVEALRREGLEVGVGKVWGCNNCLADSLLQLMQLNNIVARAVNREVACDALRLALTQLPLEDPLRPRDRDPVTSRILRVNNRAYLQSDVHGEFILKFFMRYFEARDQVLAQLPSTGVRIEIVSRLDSEELPHEYTDVCRDGVPNLDEEQLTFMLYNRTGDGFSGYHYDPVMISSARLAGSANSISSRPGEGESQSQRPRRRIKRKSSVS